MNNEPKISIVTPVYNCEKYIETCILSIKNQDYPNYEHIIVDACSTDGTLDIIKKYENTYPMKWISEPDHGMYDAINKGFRLATGDIFAWLNADDSYMPHAFDSVVTVMKDRNIQWCTGLPVMLTEDGRMYKIPKVLPVYLQCFLKKGYMDGRVYRIIQQESTFWTKDLWNKAGGVDAQYQYAGDYWLWRKFAQYEKLYTLDTILAGFRKHKGQKTDNIEAYMNEVGSLTLYKKILIKFKIIRTLSYFIAHGEHHEQLVRMERYWEK